MIETVIRSRRVVLPDGINVASVHVANSRVAKIGDWNDVDSRVELIDAGDAVVMPGVVDAHVHVNEPGRIEWEGYETATRAAAAGGVTTIVDMPLNSIPPTTTLAGFEEKLAVAKDQCSVDVAFWGGVVPGNTNELGPLVERGVRGFKCFLVHSGVDEFPHVTEEDLRIAMPEIARLDSLLLVHAEVAEPIDEAAKLLIDRDPRAYDTFLRSRPREAENTAIAMMIRLCRETHCRIHIVHLSSSDALPMLREAKAQGLPITAETCPHYLTFAAQDIDNGATHFKCCPPIRERENREKLWAAIADGTVDMVVSDHSPCTPEMKLLKEGDFMNSWGGISALQFGLPVMWTNLKSRGFGITDLTRLMSEQTARLAGLETRKGKLAVGYDADIVIWNPDEKFTIIPEIIHHKHNITPYSGLELAGRVISTYVRGNRVFENGDFADKMTGILLI
jgi:allantoinase